MKLKFFFKDGLEITQSDEFSAQNKPELFYGLSNSFKNNAEITVTNDNDETVKRNFNDLKKIEIVFND